MDTSQIDGRLQEYTAAEHRIGANLHELEDHAVYRLFTSGVLQGKTQAAFAAVQSADPSLWDLYTILSSALDRARSIRGTRSWISGDERAELIKLLSGREIVVRSDDVPLLNRDLTAAAERVDRASFAELIDRMRHMYEPVRAAVAQADAILDGLLPRLTSADQTLARLRSDTARLGLDGRELDRIAETIERIRELSLTDPLSIPTGARASLDQALHDAGAAVAESQSSHDAIAHDLSHAHDLLDRCRSLIADSVAARAQAMHKVVLDAALPVAPNVNAIDGPRGLAATLQPVTVQRGPWQQTRRELDGWLQRARRFERQLERVSQRIHAPLERRAELRGRLSAFRAKMSGVGRSEDAALTELSDEVHNELYTSPSDLDRAERLLAEFTAMMAT
jgi:chromosome segregation ATPase